MEIILKQDVENLGYKDEVVSVRDGYGRNFLIPKGMAVLATPSARKVLAENLKQRAHKEARVREEAQETAAKLGQLKLTIGAKAGEGGKIFGSVNTVMVADAIQEAGITVDRRKISIKEEPIKNLGTYQATIQLHKEVSQTISFEVVAE